MLRKGLFSLAVAVAGIFYGSAAQAGLYIESNTINFVAGSPLTFDFSGSPQFSSLTNDDYLVKIQMDALFTPGSGQTTKLNTVGELRLTGSSGGFDVAVNPGLAINADVKKASSFPTTLASASNSSSSGLGFSDPVLNKLLASGGVINGSLLLDSSSAWNDFFAQGGDLDLTLKMWFERETDGNNTVPEPASLLVWGSVLGAGAWVRRRRAAKKA